MYKPGAEHAALIKVAVEVMAAQFTNILRLKAEMEPGKSLMAYSLDSLAAVGSRFHSDHKGNDLNIYLADYQRSRNRHSRIRRSWLLA